MNYDDYPMDSGLSYPLPSRRPVPADMQDPWLDHTVPVYSHAVPGAYPIPPTPAHLQVPPPSSSAASYLAPSQHIPGRLQVSPPPNGPSSSHDAASPQPNPTHPQFKFVGSTAGWASQTTGKHARTSDLGNPATENTRQKQRQLSRRVLVSGSREQPSPKIQFVSGPDRTEYDKLQDRLRQEGIARARLEQELAQTRHAAQQNHIKWEELFQQKTTDVEEDEDMDDEAEKAIAAEKIAAAEKQIADLNNNLASLMSKRRGFVKPTPKPKPSVPQMIPCFVPKETQLQQRVKTLKGKRRDLPTTALRCAEGGSDIEGDGDGDDPEELLDTIRRMILDVLGEMGIKKPKTGGKRSPSKRSRDVKAQQASMTRDEDLNWKRGIRAIWRETHGVVTVADFQHYTPALSERVEECNEGVRGPDEGEWTLDMGPGYKSSLWNAEIIERFVEGIQTAHRESQDAWGLPEVSDEYLVGQFHHQLKQAQEVWAKHQLRLNPMTLEWETEEQMENRLKLADTVRKEKTKSTSTRNRKYQRRKNCVERMSLLKEADATDKKTWKYYGDLLKILTKAGMSSEEEDLLDTGVAVVPVFKIKKCAWRARPFAAYMQDIDDATPAIKLSRGTQTLPRIRVDDEGTSKPPLGLPEGCYDEGWLREQRQKRPLYVKKELKVSSKRFTFLVGPFGKGKQMDDDEDW